MLIVLTSRADVGQLERSSYTDLAHFQETAASRELDWSFGPGERRGVSPFVLLRPSIGDVAKSDFDATMMCSLILRPVGLSSVPAVG